MLSYNLIVSINRIKKDMKKCKKELKISIPCFHLNSFGIGVKISLGIIDLQEKRINRTQVI